MEEKEEGIEGVVAEEAIGEVATVVKWEEGKCFLCLCVVVQHTDCGVDRDCGKSVVYVSVHNRAMKIVTTSRSFWKK